EVLDVAERLLQAEGERAVGLDLAFDGREPRADPRLHVEDAAERLVDGEDPGVDPVRHGGARGVVADGTVDRVGERGDGGEDVAVYARAHQELVAGRGLSVDGDLDAGERDRRAGLE